MVVSLLATPASPPLRARLRAWRLDALDDALDRLYGVRKRALFRELPARVVELCPGPGSNFRYYPAGTSIVAIEPNAAMHARLRARAERHHLRLDLHPVPAEALDLPNGEADVVVSALVLGGLADPRRALAEVRRVLRPGGRFIFVEHASGRRWRRARKGAPTCNDVGRLIQEAGFSATYLDRFAVRLPFTPTASHVAGVSVC